MNDDAARATNIAAVCATAMIAWQIAAKTTRDGLFLIHFDVTSLPAMVVVSSLLSMAAVPFTSAAMARLIWLQ